MSTLRVGLPSRDQRGQALVLTIAFSAVCAVMVFFIFSTSQLANQKTKLQNTADSAAYSAGVLQARDYNFSAYTNRAIVANHVAMAQMVGLDSWTDEITKEFKSDPFVPYASKSYWVKMATLGLLWSGPEKIAYEASLVARKLFDVEKKGAPSLELVIEALRTAQIAFHDATILQFGAGSVEGVVKANDPMAAISKSTFNVANTLTEITQWKNYTKTMTSQAELKRNADVTVDSAAQDGFTHSRNVGVRLPLGGPEILLSPFSPVVCLVGVPTVMSMEETHGGGTQLSTDMKRWFAIDAAGVFGGALCVELDVIPTPIPIFSFWMEANAHGGSMAGKKSGYGGFSGYSTSKTSSYAFGQVGGALLNPVTEIPGGVQYAEGPGAGVASNYQGIRKYEDVSGYAKTPTSQVDAANTAPTLTIEVEKKGTDIHTAAQVLPGNAMLKLDDQLKGGVMRAVASSQTYFMRPQKAAHLKLLDGSWKRGDNKTEYASLFNPYWQTRLVATPALEVDASSAAQ